MNPLNWASFPEGAFGNTLGRRAFHGHNITLAWFALRKGRQIPAHSHQNEQMSTVLRGSARFCHDGRPYPVRAGETLHAPPGADHSAEALEDSVVFEAFAPVRSDRVQGQDTCVRAS